MFENIKTYLDEFERLGIPGFDISVYHRGKEVFREMRGACDEYVTPMTGRERYNIYSCSKLFTCVAAMMLLEEGKIRLTDEVALYIPAFADVQVKKGNTVYRAERPITIFHLFTMTGGLNYNIRHQAIAEGIKATEGKAPTVEMIKYIAKIPLEFEPGTRFNYSLCHDVLAGIVEIASGKRFGEFVRERIFEPMGMKNTTFSLPECEIPGIMAQYCFNDTGYKNLGREIWHYKFGPLYESGGAGAVSTVDDYIRFLEGLRTGKLLMEDTLALMCRDHLRDEQREDCWTSMGYGYGLGVRTPLRGFPRTDFGWGGAAGSYLSIDPKNEISIYYAQHVLNSPNSNLRKDIIEAVKLDLGYPAYKESMWCGEGSTLA